MPRKCSVYGCRSGYDSERQSQKEKIKVYGFPSDVEECRQWISALPNDNIEVGKITQYMGVCEKHWPHDAPMQLRGRYLCPSLPPSCFFEDIPKSSLPTSKATPRSTPKALSTARTTDIDQSIEFPKIDCFTSQSCEQFYS
ncbi:hypothetical protein PoB_004018700 [Plakobranchus ocellatus]|uniref:THAP-type domain-containing protein n=1 Tax=Plakobranchus ocellatus TaxID=259542 RepID=A0AAV4B3G7_9GAST|nr:hypothetical protein PoB_004018700 [Plakobranchus ocellatus]